MDVEITSVSGALQWLFYWFDALKAPLAWTLGFVAFGVFVDRFFKATSEGD